MDPLQQAYALAQAGDLEGSARLCRAILTRTPAHDYALFLLGSIEAQQGRLDEAAKHLKQAIKTNPRSPDALASYGKILLEQKRAAEAIDALTRALALRPQFPTALILRGQSFVETGKSEEALKDFDSALRLEPRSILALNNRARLLITMNRHGEARASVDALLKFAPSFMPGIVDGILILIHDKKFKAALSDIERALSIEPKNPDLWNSHAQVLSELERHGEALVGIGKAIALGPGNANFHVTRGNIELKLRRSREAQRSFETAIALDPKCASAHLNCANMLMEEERLEDALARCALAIAADPHYAPALLLRGNILLHLGRQDDSLASYDAAVAAAPDYADAHYHRGSALLLQGKFRDGFADFEYRWKASDCGFDRPSLNAREWRGEPLGGKTIAVYSEQGLGDTIQFARFLPVIAQTGARLTFLCHPGLVRLFAPYASMMEIIAVTDTGRPFDFQCALMSLPHRLGIHAERAFAHAPYVFAEKGPAVRWRDRIGHDAFKIGIAWQGNPRGLVDRGRSIPLAQFAPLGKVPGVRLISIQRTHGLDQLQHLPEGMTVETLGDFDVTDDAFIDTAAIMMALDLVVTSDTAIAHLAGALGVPCWVALKQVPDWRWMLDRTDSPWYASLRLFRQERAGDWPDVFDRIAQELRLVLSRDALKERT